MKIFSNQQTDLLGTRVSGIINNHSEPEVILNVGPITLSYDVL